MSIRIATTIEENHLKLVKVRCCGACPNATQKTGKLQEIAEGKEKPHLCDLLDFPKSEIKDLDSMLAKCPLPALLEISQKVGKCTL